MIGNLEVRLSRAFPDTLAGLWIEHDPYKVVIAATDTAGMSTLVRNYGLAGIVEFRQADRSYEELLTTQRELRRQLPASEARTGLDIPNNKVVVSTLSTLDPATARGLVDNLMIDYRLVDAFPEMMTILHGGGNVFCTSGFSVKKTISGTVWKGITTAGDCPNITTWSQSGESLTFRGELKNQFNDEQWHTLPGNPNAADNLVFDGQPSHTPPYFQPITGKRAKNELSIGAWYCKYGITTRFDCGQLKDKNNDLCSGAQDTLYFENNNVVLTDHGDSGGPWFDNSYAVGTISCGGGGTSYAVDINTVLTGLGLTLLTN